MQVLTKSTHSFRRKGADKPFPKNLSLSVTLKMGSRSPKSNKFFSMSQQYRCTNLVKAHPFILEMPALVAQLDAPSDWRPGGRGFNPRRGQQHSFEEIDHEIFSTVILSLLLIQEGQLSVSGERMCTTAQ